METERRLDSGGEEGGSYLLVSIVSVVDTGGAHAAWRRIVCLGGDTWMILMTRGVTAHSTMIAWNNISISVCFCLFFLSILLFGLLAGEFRTIAVSLLYDTRHTASLDDACLLAVNEPCITLPFPLRTLGQHNQSTTFINQNNNVMGRKSGGVEKRLYG